MKVRKGKGIIALIKVLPDLYDHNSVRDMAIKLDKLIDGQDISQNDRDQIFGEWDKQPNMQEPYKITKAVVNIIKQYMFQ
ncbi:MAG: hypothetical protein Q8N08_00420 [Methanobacteriaceae archaeon]|nr:hypothetical protein [Methanobacteriaceae archaeon]